MFYPHPNSVDGAIQAVVNFGNGWGLGVIQGPSGVGFYCGSETYETCVLRYGELHGDPQGWQTKEQIISSLQELETRLTEPFTRAKLRDIDPESL